MWSSDDFVGNHVIVFIFVCVYILLNSADMFPLKRFFVHPTENIFIRNKLAAVSLKRIINK